MLRKSVSREINSDFFPENIVNANCLLGGLHSRVDIVYLLSTVCRVFGCSSRGHKFQPQLGLKTYGN